MTAVESAPVIMSEGRRQLRAIVHRDGVRPLARRLAVSHSTVSRWTDGSRVPSPFARRVLDLELEIPAEAWDRVADFGLVTLAPPDGATLDDMEIDHA